MKHKNRRTFLLVIIEIALLLVCAGFLLRNHISSQNGILSVHETAARTVTETAETAALESIPAATLFFASDYQYENGWDAPAATLASLLDAAEDNGKNIEGVIMCGDYSNVRKRSDYQISPENSIREIRGIISEKCPDVHDEQTVFVQGNHDALTGSLSESGLHEYDNYLVYVLNTQQDFPWSQGKTAGSLNKVKKSSAEMKECLSGLIRQGEMRPVIIAGHVPLHFSGRTSFRHDTGDNMYSSLIFDVVNEAAESLDIIYLFGHNHSKGWDCYLGGSAVYRAAGDRILIPEYTESSAATDEYTEEKLNFTYLNAGYTGYYMNCSVNDLKSGNRDRYNAADMTLTGTICEIYRNRIVLTRFDSSGVHRMCADGCADPYKDGIDRDLIPEEEYSKELTGPQTVVRKASGHKDL